MPHPLTTEFGRIVRDHREAVGISQEELAERTGVSRNYIGMIERGETNPTLIVMNDLARALGTTLQSLIENLRDS